MEKCFHMCLLYRKKNGEKMVFQWSPWETIQTPFFDHLRNQIWETIFLPFVQHLGNRGNLGDHFFSILETSQIWETILLAF